MWIRQATTEDAAPLSRLAQDTYREHFATIWRPRRLAAYLEHEFSRDTLVRALAAPDQAWYLAGDPDAALLGYAKVNWQRPHAHAGITGAHLQKLYFRAAATGRGQGAQMLAHVVGASRARGERWLWLEVLGINERARRFYARHGFVHLGTSSFAADTGPIAMHAMGLALD
jgi:ribosomal protein S18 acetylase RimI-like enzyme